MKNKFALLTLLLAVTATTACGIADQTTAPAPLKVATTVSPNLTGTITQLTALLTSYSAMIWRTPVANATSASVRVTRTTGGVIQIPGLGATLTIPAGAVAVPTTITMTALPGYVVAYEYGPAGTKFELPLIMRQDLSKTWWLGAPFSVVYFQQTSDIDQKNHTVKGSETLPVTLSGTMADYQLWHFSGYALSSSRQ